LSWNPKPQLGVDLLVKLSLRFGYMIYVILRLSTEGCNGFPPLFEWIELDCISTDTNAPTIMVAK
jgi:hypothetical protein